MNLNFPPPPFEDHDHQPHLHHFAPNHRISSSSSSVACHFLFDSTQDHDDHTAGYNYHDHKLYPQHHQEVDNYAYYGGGSSTYEIKNKVEEASGLKLTLWKNQADHHHHVPEMVSSENNNINNNQGGVKWMSSKMRLMQKMKNNPDRNPYHVPKINDDDQKLVLKQQSSCNVESSADGLSSSTNGYSCSYNNNMSGPVRVCSDCNTTKTPLWRSGPKGPKSLCNACGIRQRKARRAMAAAANDKAVGSTYEPPAAAMKIKVQHKDKSSINTTGKNGHAKKRLKIGSTDDAGSTTSNGQKIGFEDFLINLSKKLAFHRVFPEDERDAAILLMALSSGLVHG